MSKRRTVGVRKCLNRFSQVADDVEAVFQSLPSIGQVSVKDLARTICAKYNTDYTSTFNLVSMYCRMSATDGRMVVYRGMVAKPPAKVKASKK